MLFSWLRSRVKAAVLSGIEDAIAALESSEAAPRPVLELPDGLRQRLEAPLPVEDGETAANGSRRKGR